MPKMRRFLLTSTLASFSLVPSYIYSTPGCSCPTVFSNAGDSNNLNCRGNVGSDDSGCNVMGTFQIEAYFLRDLPSTGYYGKTS